MSNSGGGVWDNSVWARYISPMLQQLGQNVGTPNASVPYDRQVRWDPQVGGYVKVQNQFGQPVRSADINLLPSPQLPQGAPYQPPSAPMPGSGGMGFGGQMGRLGGQLGQPQPRLGGQLGQGMPQRPQMRAPQQPPTPTGPYAGNMQGSMFPADMPLYGQDLPMAAEGLAPGSALPQFQTLQSRQLPQQGGMSALLNAILRR